MSPRVRTGRLYATPQKLFQDGMYYQVLYLLEVEADECAVVVPTRCIEWLAPTRAVRITGLAVFPNSGAGRKCSRIDGWYGDAEMS